MELCISTHQKIMKPDIASEMALVERCRRKDNEAFAILIDAYQNRVYGFVKKMVRNSEDASDIAQEVFIRAYQALDRFDGRSSLRTWLFRIAYNLCIDLARKQDRTPSTFTLESSEEDESPMEIADQRWDPETIVMDDELAGVVETALANMSEKLKTVLLLHDKEDFSYDEIAETLNMPVGTVKSRLFLARNHIQKAVHAYWNSVETTG